MTMHVLGMASGSYINQTLKCIKYVYEKRVPRFLNTLHRGEAPLCKH